MNEICQLRSCFRILPAGLFRAEDGRPKECPGWFIDENIANQIILNISKNSNDLVIDYEHQSINAGQNGKPAPAAGWFKNLQWRKDRLY